MRRNYWVVVANVVVLAALAGCRDSVVAPAAAPSSEPTTMVQAPSGAPSLSLSGKIFKNGEADFVVPPSGGVFNVGNHVIIFPARSICDPATSSYGAGTWDSPCTALKSAIKIHAVVSNVNGASAVDFSPALRFVPSTNPANWVWLYMYTPDARGAKSDLSRFNIFYTSSPGGALVNDAAVDPSVRTYVDTATGSSFRRIKHFSGYVVNSGFADDGNGSNGGY